MVMAQQVSTGVACQLAERMKCAYPTLTRKSQNMTMPDLASLRAIGLPTRRAQCCIDILRCADDILARVREGWPWEQALAGIKGIGPWTISVFRIMVLRDPDQFPARDVGLQRAIINLYGTNENVEDLSEKWRPFRSVACWYLWRTLGNQQLG
jgi:DNA-3-methyladenine glycosylase II